MARRGEFTYPCGTWPAAKRHYKLGETPCGPCLEASRANAREYYRKNREAVLQRNAAPPRDAREVACHKCGIGFLTKSHNARYCSDTCRPKAAAPKRVTRNPDVPSYKRTGRPWRRLRAQVLAEEPGCALCGGEIDPQLTYPDPFSGSVDHIVPLAVGGAMLDRQNMQAAHLWCNIKKGSRSYDADLRRLAA